MPSKHAGFTLVELMIVMTIMIILAGVATPSFFTYLKKAQLNSTIAQLTNDLNRARGEAIKRNSRVLLCVRNAAGNGCAASTNWLSGWVVCTTDAVTSTACDTASSPNPFIVRPALDTSLTLTVTDAASVALSTIRLNANSSQGAGSSAATLTLSGTWSGATAHTVTVASTGNISKH